MSLNLRIILSATLVLVIFITLTAATLDRAFYDSTESALRDRLTSQLYALMAAAEVDDDTIMMPSSELDALLGLPSSGVYAYIADQQGNALWQSSSVLGASPPPPVSLTGGQKRFARQAYNNTDYYTLAYGVSWSTEHQNRALTFNIVSDLASFNRQIKQYRTTLWGWLVAMALLLLVSQGLILHWGLRPLRQVGVELNQIENGLQQQIEKPYPAEIDRLTQNINQLLKQERDQKTRYRNALGDLAHSLKTPLAILQGGLQKNSDASLQEQITRMNSIVEYQLQRAATAGSGAMGTTLDVSVVASRILDSLTKVYRDKNVKLELIITPETSFRGDEGDLMELLGNLLDNSFKWCNQQIRLSAHKHLQGVEFIIEDDGPGIESSQATALMQRGIRADQSVAGHGIGLSIVGNIVEAYQGSIDIQRSELGGVKITVKLS